jgi:hypothetical protein
MSDHSYKIISIATLQVKDKKKKAREIIHKVIDIAVQVAASLAAGAAGTVSNALTAESSLLRMLSSVNMLKNARLTSFSPIFVSGTLISTGIVTLDPAKFDWSGILANSFGSSSATLIHDYLGTPRKVQEARNATKPSETHLNAGLGRDGLCSSFEGDQEDLTESNNHNLKELMSDWFYARGRKEEKLFDQMSKGWVAETGIPSMRAIYFAQREWPPLYGERSEQNPLTHTADLKDKVRERILKFFLGRTMSEDNVYLVCMHVHDAQKQCEMDPAKQSHSFLQTYRKTMVCPKKPEDPTLICQATRWYSAVDFHSHIVPMPGIDQIEAWQVGGTHFSIKALLQEAYDFYEIHRNNATLLNWSSEELKEPSFNLPVCVSDNLRLHDMNEVRFPSESHLEFPFFCGNFAANESAQFMKAMNLGPGSKLYEDIENPAGTEHHNALFWNLIPKVCICTTRLQLPTKTCSSS